MTDDKHIDIDAEDVLEPASEVVKDLDDMENSNMQDHAAMQIKQLEVFGVLALIFGIVGFSFSFCCAWLVLPLPVFSILFGMVSIVKIRKHPELFYGLWLAVTGIVFGMVSILLVAFLTVIAFMHHA